MKELNLSAPMTRASASGGDLSQLPLTTRDQLRRDQLEHLPHGTRHTAGAAPAVRAGVSGSGATLLVLTWTALDLARERAAGARLLGRLGIRAGMRVANTLPGALATPGALLLGDVVEEIGGLDIPLGGITSDASARAAWDMFERVQPQVLVLDAASGAVLARAVPAAARPWWQGIVWLQLDAAPVERPSLPTAAGFSGWQRTWLAVAEATSFVAYACPAGRFHADPQLLVEVVDTATGAALPLGSIGSLAMTPLGLETTVLRYRTGWRGRIASGCTCGSDEVGFDLITS